MPARTKRLQRGLRLLARRMREEGFWASYENGALVLHGQEGTLRLTARECLAHGLNPERLAKAFGFRAHLEEEGAIRVIIHGPAGSRSGLGPGVGGGPRGRAPAS